MTHLFFIVLGVFVASATQLLLKNAANKQKQASWDKLIFNVPVLLAYSIFVCVLVMNIYVVSLGFAVSDIALVESLGYVFVPTLSFVFLKEPMSFRMLFAIVLILSGVIISQL